MNRLILNGHVEVAYKILKKITSQTKTEENFLPAYNSFVSNMVHGGVVSSAFLWYIITSGKVIDINGLFCFSRLRK